MEAKEKAKQLVKKYIPLTLTDFSDENFEQTKRCALIAVQEIMKAVPFNDHKKKHNFEETASFMDNCFYTYWVEVKKEIEKL